MQGLRNFRHRHDDHNSHDVEASTSTRPTNGAASVESSTTLHHGGPHAQLHNSTSNVNRAAIVEKAEAEEGEEEQPSLSVAVTVGLLVAVTVVCRLLWPRKTKVANPYISWSL